MIDDSLLISLPCSVAVGCGYRGGFYLLENRSRLAPVKLNGAQYTTYSNLCQISLALRDFYAEFTKALLRTLLTICYTVFESFYYHKHL
jgi:hypothetical protein